MDTNKGLSFSSCPLCFEIYETPKMLPCGHTFCLQCIQSMVKKSIKECPKCQKTFQLPSSGKLEDYPTNYDLLNAIEESNGEFKRGDANASGDEKETDEGLIGQAVHCYLHDLPYKFFCKSCLEQTCTNCLLNQHNPSKHKITTKEDYLQEQSQNVQKLTKQLNSLLSMENDLGKQLAKDDSKCQQEAKKLEDQIMEDLEMKIKQLRKEAEKMIKDVSTESQNKCEKLNKLRQEQSLLITRTQEQKRRNDGVKKTIEKNKVADPNKLKDIQKKVEQISKQTNHLKQSSVTTESNMHLKFQKQHPQVPCLGYLIESIDTMGDISIQDRVLLLLKKKVFS